MRKVMFLAALCVAAAMNAQSFRIGSTANVELNCPSDMKSKVGFSVGARGEFVFRIAAKGLFLDVSALFGKKNFKSDGCYDVVSKEVTEFRYGIYGIAVPVNVGYRFAVSKPAELLAAIGPYVHFGLGGTIEKRVTTYNDFGSLDTDMLSDASTNVYSDKLMNRVSWGIGFKAGAEFSSHTQLYVGYELGLNKIFRESLDCKHRTLTVGVAYMF